MNLAIMQPYFFPYAGYFALVSHADTFVFYDDVNYIKQGWINRNRFQGPTGPEYFTVPVLGRSSNKKICEIAVVEGEDWKKQLIERWRTRYSGREGYADTAGLLETTLHSEYQSIGDLARNSVIEVAAYLNLQTQWVRSSEGYGNSGLRGKDRVLDICGKEKADSYINLPGGKVLYDPRVFQEARIGLAFITEAGDIGRQIGEDRYLSVLHLIAMYGRSKALEVIHDYTLQQSGDENGFG